MWQQVKADMVFKGDSFKLPNNPHITFKLLDDPIIDGDRQDAKVFLKSRVSGKGNTKLIAVPYGSFVSTWCEDR